MPSFPLGRRAFLGSLAGAAVPRARVTAAQEPAGSLLTKPIPSSGEALPVVGLGSWITFNVGEDPVLRAECAAVMRAFFAGGGRMIDSSPMYGSAQAVIGAGLKRLDNPPVFAADKVWIGRAARGPAQIEASRRHWGVQQFDLLQVHNLLAWEAHLPLLLAMKADSRLRHVGITTSEGRRHKELERIMASQPLDFVQLTYNPLDREAEARLLPLAAEKGIAVIANRPFRQGALLRALKRHPLPDWSHALDAVSWPQLILKLIVAHPAVTCAIPATSQPAHAQENMGAAYGRLPDADLRARTIAYIEDL
jgi:diketogulonate reductase-like aldo/keto reductase